MLSDRQQQAQSGHGIVRRDVLRFGKFELLKAKLRMGRLPGCRYIYYPERSSILGPKLTKVISRGAGNGLCSIGVQKNGVDN